LPISNGQFPHDHPRQEVIARAPGPSVFLLIALFVICTADLVLAADTNGILKSEFIFERAPFPSCHASTIAESDDTLIAAWFGGTEEQANDVGIWLSRKRGTEGWSAPIEVANGAQADKTNRLPCWNPVLFQPSTGVLLLFYKVGPSPSRWWGMVMKSTDAGKTWSKPAKLPDNFLGPIKDKPVQLADGRLLCPSSTEHNGWRLHMEFCSPDATDWSATPPLNWRGVWSDSADDPVPRRQSLATSLPNTTEVHC
jgi:hypothetical protein